MAYPHKKHVVLTAEMEQLKQKIARLKKEQREEAFDLIHKHGRWSQFFFEGMQRLAFLLGSIITVSKEIPIIGSIFQSLSIAANVITTLTDKNSSIQNRILAALLLVAIGTLAVTAVALGGTAALEIGLAIASVTVLLEAVGFGFAIANKYQTRKTYKEKKEFINLLQQEDIRSLSDDKYREQLEIRALELEHQLKKPNHANDEQLQKELAFIQRVRREQGWDKLLIADDSDAAKLFKLFREREEALKYLGKMLQSVDQEYKETTAPAVLVELIANIQHQVAELDVEIENITQPLHLLQRQDLLAEEAIAKSYVNLSLGVTSIALSTIGLMFLLGVFAAPPVATPIFLGFGIGLAAFGIIKWSIELYASRKDEQFMAAHTKECEEVILEEALDYYQHGVDKGYKHEGKCSYSTALEPLLESRNTRLESASELENPLQTIPSLVPVEELKIIHEELDTTPSSAHLEI